LGYVQSIRAVKALEIDLAKHLRAHFQSPPAFNAEFGSSNQFDLIYLMTSRHSPSKSPSVAFQPYWEGIVKCTIRHGFKGMQSPFQEIPGNPERLTDVCSNSEETLQSGINHIQLVFHVTHILCNKAAMIGAIMGIPISGLSPNTVTLKKVQAF